jgi:hypothetical protein
MKALVIALCLLIFSLSMAAVSNTGLFTARGMYESEYLTKFQSIKNMTNLTKTDLDAPTMDVFQIFISTLTFGWIVPIGEKMGIGNEMAVFAFLLDVLLAALIGIAFIEMFFRQGTDLLGGGG